MLSNTVSNDEGLLSRQGSDETRALQVFRDEQTTTESGDRSLEVCGNRKRYSVISQEAREQLLDCVIKRRMKIKEAARACGLKFSTSKAILATYRKEGRVGKKKTRARKTKVINTVVVAEVNPFDPTKTKFIPMVSVSETKVVTSDLEEKELAESVQNSHLITQAQDAYLKKGMNTETVKDMLEVASVNARINILNDLQGVLMNIVMTSCNPQLALFQVQNFVQSMKMNYKSQLEGHLAKKSNASGLLPSQDKPITHPAPPKVIRPNPILPAVHPIGMSNLKGQGFFGRGQLPMQTQNK